MMCPTYTIGASIVRDWERLRRCAAVGQRRQDEIISRRCLTFVQGTIWFALALRLSPEGDCSGLFFKAEDPMVMRAGKDTLAGLAVLRVEYPLNMTNVMA